MNDINAASVLPYLQTKHFGHTLRCYTTIDSTNTEAKRRAVSGDPHGTVYVAEEQTQGKGRLGRQWVSPPGDGLWFTVLLRPDCPPSKAAGLTVVTGLAVCRAIRKLCNIDAQIKWPNDIVHDGKKLCGILLETGTENGFVSFVAVGIGINVNTRIFPDEIAYKASSLYIKTGEIISRGKLLAEILNELEALAILYFEHGIETILPEYRMLCVTLGRNISALRHDGTLEGTAIDITDDGELLVHTKDGRVETIFTGEVSVQGIYEETQK